MGNTQSAEKHHRHQHNKLAKPRTNTIDSLSSVSSRNANLSPSDRQQIKSLLLSPLERDIEQISSDEDFKRAEVTSNAPQQAPIPIRANSLSCFGSVRNSSSKLKSLPSSKVSLVNYNHAVDGDSAMKILEDVKRNSSPEELAACNQAIQSAPPSEPLVNTTEQGRLSRRSSLLNRSTSSLFRRRSQIHTPGVGTRDSLTDRPKRWSSWRTPQLDPQEEAKWSKQDTTSSSPCIQQTTLDWPDTTGAVTPRALTPGDREYSHLGSLRLGSLRIANGPPSPAASTKFAEQNWTPNLTQDEDYFMVADNSESLMMKPTKRRGHNRSKSAAASTTPPLYRKLRLSTSSRRAKTLSRVDSPLKNDPSTGEALELQIFDHEEPEPIRRLRVMNKSQDTLATIARDYRPDVDELENDRWRYDASFREEFSPVHGDTNFGEPLTTIHSSVLESLSPPATSEEPTVETEPIYTPETRRPPPTKSDSGYASEGSFVTVPRKPLPTNSPLLARSRSTRPGVCQPASGCEGSIPVDQKSCHYASPQPLLLASANKHVQQDMLSQVKISESAECQPLSLHTHTIDHESPSDSPCSYVLSCQIPDTEICKSPVSTSKFSVDSKTSTPKRLQKRRPSQQEMPLVQVCNPVPERTIPSIPVDVRAHFIRRMSETPEIECLERTYAIKDHTADTESQMEPVEAIPIVFPSPPESPKQRGRHHKRSNTERPPSPSSSRGFRRSLSLFRSKSKARKEKERDMLSKAESDPPSATLVDLGTISASLGQSPYDVAMPLMPRTVTSPTHPHQLGNAMLPAKSTRGMDAQTAVDYARTRSKDLAVVRPKMAQRPKSYHDSAMDGGEGSLFQNRLRNLHGGDVPPVPNLQRPSTASASVAVPANVPVPVPAPVPSVPVPEVAIQTQPAPATSEPKIRARSTGRGRVVSEMVSKYDHFGPNRPSQEEWQAYTQIQKQRRKSVGESLHEQQPRRQRSFTAYSTSQPPPHFSGNTSHHGPGYGSYGAPVRQLHSYVNRRGAHYNVPFAQSAA